MIRIPKSKRLLLVALFTATLLGAAKPSLDDGAVRDRIMIKLGGDQEVKGGGLGIDVKDGQVTLSGKVETEKQKSKAEKLTRKISGVKGVDNRIQVVRR